MARSAGSDKLVYMLKPLSLVSLAAMVIALLGLYMSDSLFSPSPAVIVVQCLAAVLMLWARITFGGRSFHAAANPTSGGLVTSGPYRFIRHPIYTAACAFGWAGSLHSGSVPALLLGLLLFGGAVGRMLCEERLVAAMYPEYRAYAKATKRMIPYVF
jgi:protein-S-isoprenylcysteine O-methyltransferase Ste14